MQAQKNEQARDNACVTFAIETLGETKSTDYAPVLVDYLGFKRPLTPIEQEKQRGHISMATREFYPAVTALFLIGKSAAPVVADKIANEQTTQQEMQNAIRAYMLIFRENPVEGIRSLKQLADKSPAPTQQRVTSAAKSALRWCGNRRPECEAVLNAK